VRKFVSVRPSRRSQGPRDRLLWNLTFAAERVVTRGKMAHQAICFLLIRSPADLHHVDESNASMTNRKDASTRPRFGGAPHKRLALCLWAIFAAGLLVEMAAPRLKIENNAFVMPPINNAQAMPLRPDVLVRRERWMQAASGLLTLGSTVALGVYYRRTLAAALKG